MLGLIFYQGLSNQLLAQPIKTLEEDPAAVFFKVSEQVSELEAKYLKSALQEKSRRVFAKLNEGKLKYLSEDYRIASMLFLEIVENDEYRRQLGNSINEAIFYLADSLYHINHLRSSKIYFEKVVTQTDPRQSACIFGRLLQISLDLKNASEAQKYKQQALNAIALSQDPNIAYFLGKYSYEIGQYDEARSLFARVQNDSSVYPQSIYFQAMTYIQQKDYAKATQVLQSVLTLNLDDLRGKRKLAIEQSEIVDQTTASQPMSAQGTKSKTDLCHFRSSQEQKTDETGWEMVKAQAELSIARLYYEMNELEKANQAYLSIGTTSLLFKEAIEESVWLAIKNKKYDTALQRLDILLISDPSLLGQPQTRILQGRLMSISNRYSDAESLFEEINEKVLILKERYISPILIQAKGQLAVFFQQKLKDGNITLNLEALLPKELREFAKSKLSNSTARSLFVELATLQKDLDESQKDIRLLEWALSGTNQAERFPLVHEGLLKTLELRSQLIDLHLQNNQRLAKQLPTTLSEVAQKKIKTLIDERDRLLTIYQRLPKTAFTFREQEASIEKSYLIQELQSYRLRLELQNLEAQFNALDQYLKDPKAQEIGKSLKLREKTSVLEQIKKELPEVQKMKEQVQALIDQSEKSILRVGLSDEAYVKDDQIRKDLQKILVDEMQFYVEQKLCTANDLNQYLFIDQKATRFENQAKTMVLQNTLDLKNELEKEKNSVRIQQQKLSVLQQQANQLAGQIVSQAFYLVLEQIDELILENDAALLDVFWSKKNNVSKDLEKEQGYRRAHIDILNHDMVDTKQR
jgi:hypothetical protein